MKNRARILVVDSGNDLRLAMEILRAQNIHGIIAVEHRVNMVDEMGLPIAFNVNGEGRIADGVSVASIWVEQIFDGSR